MQFDFVSFTLSFPYIFYKEENLQNNTKVSNLHSIQLVVYSECSAYLEIQHGITAIWEEMPWKLSIQNILYFLLTT